MVLMAGLAVVEHPVQANPSGASVLRDSGQRLGEPGESGMDVVLGDVDNDGDLDAVTVGLGMPGRIWLNDGLGRFTIAAQTLGSNAVAVAWDPGLPARPSRVVMAHDESGGSIRTWIKELGQNFLPQDEPAIGGDLPSALAIGDLGGDNRPDLVLTRQAGRPAELWISDGSNGFTALPLNLGERSGIKAELGDLDGDGDLDVFLAGEELSVWLNPGRTPEGLSGPFTPAGPAFGSGLTLGVALADLDGDGDLDAVTAGSAPERDRVWINQGGAQGGTPAVFADSGQRLGPGRGQSRDVALGDMDGDGDIDIVVVRPLGNRVYWNEGTGRFTTDGTEFGAGTSEALALGDLDRDGALDVFVVKFDAPAEVWLGEAPMPSRTVPEYRIEAWAGTGEPGSGGDGGPALAATFELPSDLAVDGAGVVYVLEGGGRRVRRIGVDGTVSTLVNGDGGPVGEAGFGYINSIAADARGNVYLAELGNRRIRRISPEGTVSTVAGTGANGPGADGSLATETALSAPSVVRLDPAGNLFVVELSQRRVYRVGTNGILTWVAGDGSSRISGDGGPARSAGIHEPDSLLAGADGSLYLGYSASSGRVRRISPGGIITTVAGIDSRDPVGNGRPATVAGRLEPRSLAFDRHGNLVLGNHDWIRQIDSRGILGIIAGGGGGTQGEGDGGPALSARITPPAGAIVLMPGGDLVFANRNRLRRLIPTGNEVPVAPRVRSSRPPGEEIDLGAIEQNSQHWWFPRRIRLRNVGNADLKVRSVELSGNTTAFRFSLMKEFDTPVATPHFVPSLRNENELRIEVECTAAIETPSTNQALLRILTDDPATPVLEYVLRSRVIESNIVVKESPFMPAEEESVFSFLLRHLGVGTQGPVQRLAATQEPTEVLLTLDPEQPRSVTTEVPEYLGGGSVTIQHFEGEVRLGVRPAPNEDGFLELTVLGGQFTAPSFSLPSGIPTGPTTLTFGDPALSSGRLNQATGDYWARASATIVNPLFPGGLPVVGSYRGTYDAASGRATLQSFSTDRVPRAPGLQVLRHGPNAVVTWTSTSRLEEASSLSGPWQVLTNAVSPHGVNPHEERPRFYRLAAPAGR